MIASPLPANDTDADAQAGLETLGRRIAAMGRCAALLDGLGRPEEAAAARATAVDLARLLDQLRWQDEGPPGPPCPAAWAVGPER